MTYSKRFEYVVSKTLNFEGGYQINPSDSANYTKSGKLIGTNRGISAIAYEQYLGKEPKIEQIKAITPQIAKDVYYKLFWIPMQGDKLKSDGVAWVQFDSYIATGNLNIVKNAINSNNIIWASNNADSTDVINVIIEQNIKHRKSLNKPQFIDGWTKRLNELRNNALKLAFFKNLTLSDIIGNRVKLKSDIKSFNWWKDYNSIGIQQKTNISQIQAGQTHISHSTNYPWRINDKTQKNGKIFIKIKYLGNKKEFQNGAKPKYLYAWFDFKDWEMY